MLKLIYLAKRKPGFTFDQFVCRWRKHGALGMSLSNWRYALGYVQAEPIFPTPITGASEELDAVACFMIRDEMFAEMTEEDMAGAGTMAMDELETFSGPIPGVSLWVTEECVKAGELGGIAAYLFFASAEAAREVATLAGKTADFNRIVLNLLDDTLAGMNTLPYTAVVELSASDIPTLVSVVGTSGTGLHATADLTVVTREAVMWDRLPHPA